MKLYYFHVAPNPTRVLLYLAEKAEGGCEIPLELQLVDVRKGEQNPGRVRGHVKVVELHRISAVF